MNNIGYILNESAVRMEDVDIISEKGDRVIGTGRLQTGGERNRNGRRYLTIDLAREIAAPRQRELLSTGNMIGEAGHPLSKELVRQQTIDPKNQCVRYVDLWMDGDDVRGKFMGTYNDLGNTFDQDLRHGVKPAFSLRALGTLKSTREGAVVENLKIITYDYVIYPSHPGAYTSGLVSESAGLMDEPVSGFDLSKYPGMDATQSFIESFTNNDVVKAISDISKNESAIDYIKDKSYNYHLLKECFDMTKVDNIDLLGNGKIALTESGNSTIVLTVEDYVLKELRDYY